MPKESDDSDKKKKKKNTSLRLERDMLKQLKKIAIDEDTSIQEIIERLIREYLERLASPSPRTRTRSTSGARRR